MFEKKPVKRKNTPAKDLLFDKFKESPGIKIFVIKYNNAREKEIYVKVLSVLKEKGYLDFSINFTNIQVYLTDLGRKTIDEQIHWEID